MADERGEGSVLWRIALRGVRPGPEPPVTPTRALRIALTRAAERVAGLPLTALGAGDEVSALADLMARLEDDWLFLQVPTADGVGLLAVDAPLLAALTGMQTRGTLPEQEPEPRPPTAADAALCAPVASAFLEELVRLAAGTALEGWGASARIGARVADRRALGLVLPERQFRMVSVSAWLGVGERQGNIILALPEPEAPHPAGDATTRGAQWTRALSDNVLSATVPVSAILHRMRLPLSVIEGFAPGQELRLPGVRVTSVRLEAADRSPVGQGRLGQSGGMRALRIEREALPELGPTPAPTALAAPRGA
ncbi:MAG: FliM/FliN family flagellar motor switch protein [Rubellimicrobium sp.]|nr:FliM/FliN family flagellar motor switch protein [Rubellimicrobium sp.]